MTLTREQWENGRKWIEALRSNEFEQGELRLHLRGRYCCLGVAEVVVGGRTPKQMGTSGYMKAATCKKLGINEDGTLPNRVRGYPALTDLNDGAGMTFPEIADVLESQLYPPVYPGTSAKDPIGQAIPI